MARDVRLLQWKGFDPVTDQLSTMSLSTGSIVYEGSILFEDVAVTDRLTLATDKAEYLLLKRVTVDGPSFLEKFSRTDVGELKSGQKPPVFMLRVGAEFLTKVYATTGDGAISAGTAAGTDLGVIDGEVVVLQESGNGSVKFFELKENLIDTLGAINVRIVAVS